MSAKITRSPTWIGIIAGTVIAMAAPAHAAHFAVSPVYITIGHRERSHLIVITNQDNVPLRFQLYAYRWAERPSEPMVLKPTDDLVFFPRLFTIKPHGRQNVRVGLVAPAIAKEKTYRLVLHQLKSFEPPQSAGSKRALLIHVLTNVSMPVFVEPAAPVARPAINSMTLTDRTLNFTVGNSGNAHFRIKYMRVDGFGSSNQKVFSKTAKGWYVLAGSSQDYKLPLPDKDCLRVRRLSLSVETDHGELRRELSSGGTSCRDVEAMVRHPAVTP